MKTWLRTRISFVPGVHIPPSLQSSTPPVGGTFNLQPDRHALTIIQQPLLRAFIFATMFLAAIAPGASLTVPGTADPWLAGMTNGATASNGDVAPDESPTLVTGVTLIPGTALSFRVTGGVHFGPGDPSPPDGLGFGGNHGTGAENGISDVAAPWDCLLGVFLGPDQPDLSPAPASLDFLAAASRDYSTLSPLLEQVFFIGDGLTSSGVRQQLVIPPSATRLFLGPMDGSGWYNNIGSFSVWVIALSTDPVTQVDVTYTNLATPTGPVSFGLNSLPESVPAWFILEGDGTGPKAFDSNDVRFAELVFGDGTWTEDELLNFSLTVDALGEVTSLTYQLDSITTGSVTNGKILNSSFSLTAQGTDISSGMDFEYIHQDSAQELATLIGPGLVIDETALVSGGLVLAGRGGTSNGVFQLLSSPDLTVPLTNWPAILTNTFDGDGNFSLTNPASPGATQQFYRLLSP